MKNYFSIGEIVTILATLLVVFGAVYMLVSAPCETIIKYSTIGSIPGRCMSYMIK